MSERANVVPTPEGEFFEGNRFAGKSALFGILALIGIALSVVGAIVSPHQFAYSWLFGFAFYFTLLAGCFFWIVVHYAVDANWSVVVRRQLENLAVLLAIVGLCVIPLMFWRHHLYEWTNIRRGVDPLLDSKRLYLNPPFFFARTAFYFVFFIAAAYLFRRYSVRQDRDGNPRWTLQSRTLAFVSLPLFAFSLTFGAYDWLIGTDYHWFSTMWGVYIFAGSAGASMSLLVLVLTGLRSAGYLRDVVTTEHYHTMGKWILAFCVFWAYIGFGQYMLIWYANIPEETAYFIRRNVESWNVLSTFLVVGRFFIAFPLLLLQGPKKHPHRLCLLAGWIVIMQALDMYIVVLPSLHGAGVQISIWDFVPLFAIGSTLAFAYFRIVGRSSLFPNRDPRLIESLYFVN
ncbi:MAG: hypothetical protein ACJ8IQ_01520 [Chthoniobacterales bacterium]